MDSQFESVSCAICEKDDAKIFIRGTGPPSFMKCRRDGLLYMNPRPTAADVREFHVHFVRSNNLDLFGRYRQDILRREALAIQQFKTSGNLLDIGCATGTFFENFPGDRWQLYGTDTSPLGLEAARTKYDARTFCGTLREAQYPDRFFDVVTVLDTLYYNPDPKAELVEIHRVLKDDGLLAVEIPGFAYSLLRARGPLCWLFDRKWTGGFTNSWHLYYFGPSTIKLLLANAGFRTAQIIPEQASLGRHGLARALNQLHFLIAKLFFGATAGGLSLAAKELYVAVKAVPLTQCNSGDVQLEHSTCEARGNLRQKSLIS